MIKNGESPGRGFSLQKKIEYKTTLTTQIVKSNKTNIFLLAKVQT